MYNLVSGSNFSVSQLCFEQAFKRGGTLCLKELNSFGVKVRERREQSCGALFFREQKAGEKGNMLSCWTHELDCRPTFLSLLWWISSSVVDERVQKEAPYISVVTSFVARSAFFLFVLPQRVHVGNRARMFCLCSFSCVSEVCPSSSRDIN